MEIGNRVYITQRKYNKLLYGCIVGINLMDRVVTIKLDSNKLFKTNSTGYNKTFFLNKIDAENMLKKVI